MSTADMISGMVIVVFSLLGMFATYLAGKARGRSLEASSKIKPVCPCGHTAGEHDDSGACRADICRPFYLSDGYRNGHEYVVCACMKYHGPTVLSEQFFHPGTFTP